MNKAIIILFLIINLLLACPGNAEKISISDNLELIKLNENVFIHVSYIHIAEYGRVPANGMLVIDKKQAVLLDTPWNDELTYQLFDWVNENYNVSIEYVIINHFHDDNMGGLRVTHNRGAISYALDLTNEILKKKKKTIVNRIFNAVFTLKLDTIELISEYLGPAHTVDNIVTWIPQYNILFGGCMVKALAATNLGNIADADVKEWPKTVEKVKNKYKAAEIVIPGHGQYGGLELLDHTIELCK